VEKTKNFWDDILESWEEGSQWLSNVDLTPAPLKAIANDILFNSVLPGKLQNKFEFDEDFFAESDLDFIKKHVMSKVQESGQTKGNFEYKDYPSGTRSVERHGGSVTDIFTDPAERVKKTLGQFGYEVVDGQIQITDQFNFNDANKDRQDVSLVEKIRTVKADIEEEGLKSNYGKVRKVAQHLGSPEGQGSLFNLKL
tara:strand:- start:12 stop:602 length:591 start_codon:yes stop_codon:yes gene_type:complete